MKNLTEIIRDQATYIESIGKQDKETVREAFFDRGADTILRMCLGITGKNTPIRALGYVASALAVHEYYFPEAELQIVYPLRAACLENNVGITAAVKQVGVIDTNSKQMFARRFRTDHAVGGQVKSFTDFETVEDDLKDAVGDVLATLPELQQSFAASAGANLNSYIGYVAAHVLLHDTNPVLQPKNPLTFGDFADSGRNRVISIGAQSERKFYLARMACQQARILPTDVQVETGQIFTKHVLPPYIECHEGEPIIGDSIEPDRVHPVASVNRDYAYLQHRLQAERQIGEFTPQSELVPKEDRPKLRIGEMEIYYI